MIDPVATTIARFANSFDVKDWPGLESVLASEVQVDYSDLRGEVGNVPRSRFVETRRSALAALATHHVLSNLEVEIDGSTASCRASGVIYRRGGDRFFHSHVVYDFGLVLDGFWRIASIRQRVLWNEGDPSLHAGASGRR